MLVADRRVHITPASSFRTNFCIHFCGRSISPSENADSVGNFCGDNKNISSSNISENVDSLLAMLVKTAAKHGFGSVSYGQANKAVYGLAQCRGDVSSKDCSDCVQDAANEIRKACPDQADARIWYDYCFLRYDTRDFRGQVDTIGILYANVENVEDPEYFKQKLSSIFNKTNSDAIVSSNKHYYRIQLA